MIGRLLVGCALLASNAAAQQSVRVEVRDDQGAPVAYALIAPVGGVSRVATDSGVTDFRMRAADSLNLRVRRIGHREHFGWVKRTGAGVYLVQLDRLAASLSTVEVTAAGSSSNAPLVRSGFYDRMDRVQRGAIVGDHLTPELLDERGASTVTGLIAGTKHGRVDFVKVGNRSVAVAVGRGRCGMTVLLDGQVVRGTMQDRVVSEAPQSIVPAGSRAAGGVDSSAPSIDDVVDGRAVMAIEIYPSSANAPAELQRLGGRGSCGIIALWTGARR